MRKLTLLRLLSALAFAFPVSVLAGPALSHDALSPDAAAVDTAADQCPVLTQVKYPWATCATDEHGAKSLVLDSRSVTWESKQRIPIQGEWVREQAYYGPE